jgi:hypothetical protein
LYALQIDLGCLNLFESRLNDESFFLFFLGKRAEAEVLPHNLPEVEEGHKGYIHPQRKLCHD